MKTKFTTIVATVALLLSTTCVTFANTKTDNGSLIATEIKTVGNIDAIVASGNVDVYLVNGDYDAVKVYSDYYGKNAVIKNEDGVLSIASYAPDKLIVFVTVNDLQEITANDNASIRTYGNALYAKGLNINLNNQAVAQLKVDAIGANVTVNDSARAELAGTIENYQLKYSANSTVKNDNLKTYVSRKNKIELPKANSLTARFRMHASL